MTTPPTLRARARGVPDAGAPVLRQDPPPWVVRAVAWLLLALFAAAVGGVFLVRVPEALEAPFVLAAGEASGSGTSAPRARVTLSEGDARRVAAGARARLLFEAFPAERYGSVPAHFETTDSPVAAGKVVLVFALDETAIGPGGDRRALLPGLIGTARIVVGDRSLAERLFTPR